MSLRSGVWAVVFTDMVDSTAKRARLGDAAADALRWAHDRIAEVAVARHAGELVKGTGDGVMLAFPSAADAVAAAVAFQVGVTRYNADSSEPIRVRVGVTLGEVECEGADLHGLAVNEAARVCALAGADEILISDLVRVVAGSRLVAPLEGRGAAELKGIPEPMTLWSVGWRSVPEPAPPPFPSLLGAQQPPFNGRSAELAELAGAWARAAGGSCSAVFVTGEPGIGKTRLAAEAARRAYTDGATVLYGACDEVLATPFQPFAEALGWYCDHAEVVTFGRYPDDLARLCDRVADRLSRPLVPLRAEPESERQRLFDAVVSWLVEGAERLPLVLVVDDLHWATRETLLLLRHVLRCGEDARLLVVGTYRDTELDRQHPLSEMLADFARLGTVDRVALHGLETSDVLGLVRAFLDVDTVAGFDTDAGALATSIHAETDGNAFFVNEVLRNLVDTSDARAAIPQGVRDAVGQRLTRLGDQASTVLRGAAVAGAAFALSSVVAASGVSEDEAVDVLERACAAHLVEEIGADRFRFAHALVRSTLLDEISTTRRLRMHRAIATSLELTDPDNAPDLAYHWCSASEAGDLDKAVRYSIAAAEIAMAHTAYDDARSIAQRALELVDEGDNFERSLLWVRGHAEVAIGDPVAYRPTFRRIADLASEAGDTDVYAEAVLGYVGRDETLTDLDDFARNALERSLSQLNRATAPALVCRLLGALASGVTNREPDRADRLSLEALELARAAASPEMFTHAARARLRCWWDPNATQERLALAAEFRDAATTAGLPDAVAQSWQWETILRLETAELRAMAHAVDEIERINETLNLQYLRWATTARRAALALSTGHLDEAEHLMNNAAALETHGFSVFSLQFAVLRWLQGRTHEFVDLILNNPDPGFEAEAILPATQAFFALATAESGRIDESANTLRNLFGDGTNRPDGDLSYTIFLSSAARAARLVGNGPWIEPLTQLCEPLAGKFAVINPACSSLGAIDGLRGGLALAAGRYDDAIRLLTFAIEQNRTAGLRPFVATAQADLAAAYAASGDARHAKTAAALALELATEIGMTRITRQLQHLNPPRETAS